MKHAIKTNRGTSGFENISEIYFDQLSESFCCLLNGYHVEQKFDLVVGNFLELESDVYQAMMNHMVGRYPGWVNFLEVQLTVDRRLSNFLSACRTYFDQIYRHMVLCFKGDRSQAKSLKAYASSLYEKSFDYRLMEALRNHVQHHSLAVHSAKVGGRHVGHGDQRVTEFGVGFSIYKRELSYNKRFKASVLAEMKDEIEIVSTVRGYIDCINLVQLRARALLDSRLEESRLMLMDASGGSTPHDSWFEPVAIRVGDDGSTEKTIPLVPLHGEQIQKLRMKNTARSKFKSGYFTSSPLN
ncbi:hypothetical protein [Marinobacter phage PS3]|nr:hypothetical protein [Marinobacter phage PS3]